LNYTGKQIYFISENKTDSVSVSSDGYFSYTTKTSQPEFIRINFQRHSKKNLLLLVDSNDHISLSCSAKNPDSTLTISGSVGSILLQELNNIHKKSEQYIADLKADFTKNYRNTNKVIPDSVYRYFEQKVKRIGDDETEFLKQFIAKHPNSFASMSALYQTLDDVLGKPIILYDKNGLHYFEMVDSALTKAYPKSETVISFHNNVMAIKMSQLKIEEQANGTSRIHPVLPGSMVPDFSFQNIDGKTISINSFRGKVVLLDFWASWCLPCRKGNPQLVSVYKDLHRKGFDIIQISLDNNINPWIDAISHDSLSWNWHGCDFQSWHSKLVTMFNVKSLPANFLIDKSGKIVAENIPEKDLLVTIQKQLK